jgi:hypothetical protein
VTSESAAADVTYAAETAAPEPRVLACAETVLALRSDDRAAADWLAEFLQPWFTPSAERPEWSLTVSASADRRRELLARRPPDPARRPCFALDRELVSLPSWYASGGVAVDDAERSCLFLSAPARVDVLPERTTRRWRFTLQWICHEIAATRLRRTALDLHAAAVETDGKGIAIVGPKGAGKTTLSFHLLRSGRCRWVANDRAFARREPTGFQVRGMPTPVKVLAPTLLAFPELRRGLRPIERPYLHSVAEAFAEGAPDDLGARGEFALSPAQVAHALRVTARAVAPLAAIVFPELRGDLAGFTTERLRPGEVAARLESNVYGRPSGRTEATLFEEHDGGRAASPCERADRLSEEVPAYRVALGPDAYAVPGFAARFLESIGR